MKILILLLQGGLGNQLIQSAFAFYLSRKYKQKLILSKTLYHPIVRTLYPFITPRTPSKLLNTIKHSYLLDYLCFLPLILIRLKLSPLPLTTDTVQIPSGRYSSHIFLPNLLLGYFHLPESFSHLTLPFWKSVLAQLHPVMNSGVAVHLRMGDYLNSANSTLFVRLNLVDLLVKSLELKSNLGIQTPISIFTDQPDAVPALLHHLKPEHAESFKLDNSPSELISFSNLVSHQHIVGSNSTFSLTAAWLSYLHHHCSHPTFYTPPGWYLNSLNNRAMMTFLRNLPFTTSQ